MMPRRWRAMLLLRYCHDTPFAFCAVIAAMLIFAAFFAAYAMPPLFSPLACRYACCYAIFAADAAAMLMPLFERALSMLPRRAITFAAAYAAADAYAAYAPATSATRMTWGQHNTSQPK